MRVPSTAALLAGVFLAMPVEGQVQVRVETEEGRPLPSVQIDIWGSAKRLGSVATGPDGRAQLQASYLAGARRLAFSHLGYATRIATIGELHDGMAITLERRPIELDALTVTVARDPCTVVQDPEGRAIWEAVAARYAQDTGRLETHATQLGASGMVPEFHLFDIGEDDLRPGTAYWAPAAWPPQTGKFRLLEEVVPREGYAWRPSSHSVGGARHLNWIYPSFDGRHAYHFVTATFGELHDFRVVSQGPSGTRLAFCPNGTLGRRPAMRGSLVVSVDGMLASAAWRWVGARPDEGAGGEVVFGTYVEPGENLPHLVPVRGLFFRHNGREPRFPTVPRDYYRELRILTEWRVAPDSRH